MRDAFQPLIAQLARSADPALWFADESNTEVLESLKPFRERLQLVSNRYDVAARAESLGLDTEFSDFEFHSVEMLAEERKPRQIVYRVSKERPLVNHLINRSFDLLPLGGELWLSGQKNEGIKTYFGQASKLFGSHERLTKSGNIYHGKVAKTVEEGTPLDDRDYTRLRWINAAGQRFLSKPGAYGWDKIDKGSAFLMTHVRERLSAQNTRDKKLLDLGCGYGYLMLQCCDLPLASITATDNNAAAIRAAEANAQTCETEVVVRADDCAARVDEAFDLILCNPPFHQGFDVESALTDKFLQAARRLLAPGGRAWFVVNAFIPLERKASTLFVAPHQHVSVLASNGRFKIIEIRQG